MVTQSIDFQDFLNHRAAVQLHIPTAVRTVLAPPIAQYMSTQSQHVQVLNLASSIVMICQKIYITIHDVQWAG
jgi:hypothetical protein